jgi:hypothetical protein
MNYYPRIFLISILTLLLLFFGFKRETKLLCFDNNELVFKERFEKQTTTNYQAEVKSLTRFNLTTKIQSVCFYSLIFGLLTASILFLLSNSKQIFKYVLLGYLSYMVLSFFLIRIGSNGVDYRLSIGLAHYLEDLFVSPYILLFTAVGLKAFGLVNLNKQQ